MGRPNRKRLSMDMPITMHKELVKIAHKYNMPLTLYVLRSMNAIIKKERSYNNEINDMSDV